MLSGKITRVDPDGEDIGDTFARLGVRMSERYCAWQFVKP